MTDPRYSDQPNGERRDPFATRYANGSAGTNTGYDSGATQVSGPPSGTTRAAGPDSGQTRAVGPNSGQTASPGNGFGGYDLSKIGGSTTYGTPKNGSSSSSSEAPTTYSGGGGYGATSYGSSPTGYGSSPYGTPAAGGGAGSTYRAGRDGSVKKLGVDTQTGLPPVPDRGGPITGSQRPIGRAATPSSASRGPRRARLQLKHIDPWSTMKFSLVLAVALFVVWMIVVGLLYGVLSGLGVFDQINSLYNQVHGGDLLTGSFVLTTAAIIGLVNIVLFTAIATVGAFIYNLCADLVGGIELTLSERD